MKSLFNSKILLAVPVVFFVVLIVRVAYSYALLKEDEKQYAKQQAKTLDSYAASHREYYQNLFVDKTIKLNKKTLKALPAYSSLAINQTFSKANPLNIQVKIASDRARNPKNQADKDEMQAIEFFKKHPDKTEYFNDKPKRYYQYAKVLKIEKKCLKCHGKKEQAPEFIRQSYNQAYGYKLGEIRGILSIKIPSARLHTYFFNNFLNSILYDIGLLSVLFVIVFLLIRKSKNFNDTLRDEIDKKTDELRYNFSHDRLTGLPNRLSLIQDMENLKNETCKHLALINIDEFKNINELYGYNVGDLIIKKVAYKILEKLPPYIRLYKLPSDEYAIFDTTCKGEKEFFGILKNILDDIQEVKLDIEENPILTFSCGLASNEEMLLAKADMALQKAKEENKHIVYYKKDFDTKEKISQNVKFLSVLKDAIANDKIVPFFQPIYNIKTKKIEKYETLARIVLDDGTIVPPFAFIDVAIKSKLYPKITQIMIEKTFEFFKDKPQYEFSINLAVEDMLNKKTIRFIKKALTEFPHPQKVVFEILESSKIGNYKALRDFIDKMKPFGCKFAVDDFGSGYSNFAHILELNFDYLKIDASLIQYIVTDDNSRIITKTIINFASNLGLKTIAEFVEDKDILDMLEKMGADFAQGYFIGKPMSSLQ